MPDNRIRSQTADRRFFRALEAAASVATACRRAGYSRAAAYRWRATDAAFAKHWAEAVTLGVDTLEAEADRRARPHLVTKRAKRANRPPPPKTWRHSDTLLLARLKALRPDLYRDPPPTAAAAESRRTISVIDYAQPAGQGPRRYTYETSGT